jgi:hypothetical protein
MLSVGEGLRDDTLEKKKRVQWRRGCGWRGVWCGSSMIKVSGDNVETVKRAKK